MNRIFNLHLTTFALTTTTFLAAGCVVTTSPPDPVPTGPVSCANLKGAEIPANMIGLPTTGAVVTNAEVIAAAGTGTAAIGEYCKLIVAIHPVDATAPDIKFDLRLPVMWNKKAMLTGGGGYDGELGLFVDVVHAGSSTQQTHLGRGYAVFGSDSGHEQMPPFIYGRDASFAANDEALQNFTGDALKKTHDAAMVLIGKHYAEKVQKTYFFGGSSGGREALVVAQKWPQDFDGVISLFPFWNSAASILAFGKVTKALAAPGGYPNVPKRKLILQATLAACDSLDGVADGIVSNIAACTTKFDPMTATVDGTPGGAPLRCAGGADTGDTCLSDALIASLITMGSAVKFKAPLASGETGHPGFNVWGSDLGIPSDKPELAILPIINLNSEQPKSPMTIDMPYMSVFRDQWVKYFVTRDPSFDSFNLDAEDPGTWKARVDALSLLQDVNKADLSAFQTKGGKLVIVHGLADVLVSSRATAEYYERVKSTMGAEKTKSFLRYYEIPGYGHGSSADFNAGWDSVAALETWVEKGTAPVNPVVEDKTGIPGRTRPLCEHPMWPKYSGSGDKNLAASFTCVNE